jgi:formate dehydrogenase major subunit
VFRLPSTCFAEENGSIVNSGRWLQWHWKGADAPGIAVTDGEILAGIFTRLRKMYVEEGGCCPFLTITAPVAGSMISASALPLLSIATSSDAGFAGSWTPEGNQMARRDNADPSGLGNTLGWAWAWRSIISASALPLLSIATSSDAGSCGVE